MEPEDIDAVVAALKAGGRWEESAYHAGTRTTIWYEDGAFLHREQHAWDDIDHTGRMDEGRFRAWLAPQRHDPLVAWARQ